MKTAKVHYNHLVLQFVETAVIKNAKKQTNDKSPRNYSLSPSFSIPLFFLLLSLLLSLSLSLPFFHSFPPYLPFTPPLSLSLTLHLLPCLHSVCQVRRVRHPAQDDVDCHEQPPAPAETDPLQALRGGRGLQSLRAQGL